MPAIIQYLLKLSLSVAVIHAFYFLVLRRLTFYNLNRWYLSGYTLLCFIIPFINVSRIADKADEKLPVLNYIPSVQNITIHIPATISQPIQPAWSVWDMVIVLLAIGSVIMLLKFAVQMISFIRMKQKAEVLSDNGAVIYHVDEQIMPFSFGDSIYLNKNSHTVKELQEIIMHEYVHVKQRHSIDILIAELLCMINWYNPFAWFMRHSIRQNLEFIADDNVVRSGINKKDYQYHLLKVVGIPQYRIANQFNFSSLKKRIIMMNQQRSARIHLLKFMFILPLLAVTLLTFRSEIANAMSKINKIPHTLNFINKGKTEMSQSLSYASARGKEKIIKIQIVNDGQFSFSADSVTVDNERQFISLFGDAKLSNTSGSITAPIIMFDKNKSNGIVDFKKAFVDIDGKYGNINNIDLVKIQQVSVIRSNVATKLYGAKGKYGYLLYSTWQTDLTDTLFTLKGSIKEHKHASVNVVGLANNGFSKNNNTTNVRAFSPGEVLTTKEVGGTSLVIVKRGELFDAYSNLTYVNVKKGDKVNKGQVIGKTDLDDTGKPTLVYELYKGATLMARYEGNDTTIYSKLTTKGTGTVNSSSNIHNANGLTNTANSSFGSGNISVSPQPGEAHGLTTASSGDGSKAVTYLASNIRYVNISNDPNELTFTIDPQHIDESQFESMKKRFEDSGFDLKIKASIKQGKAEKLNISIYGSQKDNSSSAVYTASDITDNDKFIIKITANKKTGSVYINTFSEADAPK